MPTQPRISSPIARLRITTGEGRNRRGSGVGRWKPADPPMEADVKEAEQTPPESSHPPFYPFPLRSTGRGED